MPDVLFVNNFDV